MNIYLRPLVAADAKISHKWRNDSEVWQLTGSRPDRFITPEIESEWIEKVLKRPDELRFAICLQETGEYIGNAQLTGINSTEAEFHIFIGEKRFWGKGCGTAATQELVDYAFEELKLEGLYLFVNKENYNAIRIYEKVGFKKTSEDADGYLQMIVCASEKNGK